jgi:8-oxo-dGTP pyrophosphatase MutT (NUDIX family)
MKRDYTATCYLLYEEKTLLIFHKKHKKWLPPGGHIEPNELPTEAVRREVLEETGLEIDFIHDEHVLIDQPYARTVLRPYLILLEDIPQYGTVEAHQHIDLIYLAKPLTQAFIFNAEETEAIRWFSKEDILQLNCSEIFPDTVQIIDQIFSSLLTLRKK